MPELLTAGDINRLTASSAVSGTDSIPTVDANGNLRKATVAQVSSGLGARNSNKLAAIGDSITAQNKNVVGTTAAFNANGPLAWLRMLSHQRIQLDPANIYATIGYTSKQMYDAGYHVLAAQSGAGLCTILAGTNDIGDATIDTEYYIGAMVDYLLAANVRPILIPILPRGGGLTSAQHGKIHSANNYIYQRAAADSRIIVSNAGSLIVDPTSATGQPLTGMMYDTDLHPGQKAAILMGDTLTDDLAEYLTLPDPRFYDASDTYSATDNPTGNMLVSGNMIGTGGNKGTNGSFSGSNPPTGFFFDGSSNATKGDIAVTLSKEARSDGYPGEMYQMVISATTGTTGSYELQLYQTSGLAAKLNAGDIIDSLAEFEIDANPVGINSITLVGFQTTGAATFTASDGTYNNSPLETAQALRGTLRTPRYTALSGTTTHQFLLRVVITPSTPNVSATVRFGTVSSRKVV